MTIELKKDQETLGFVVENVVEIPEIKCSLIELVHKKTGAKVMHIANDDEENVFCLAFQTIPKSSNGIAHILEHCVLCGSKKFPVRDPFFSMSRRSLNTFMNAMTGPDFTCYPAASQVPGDFYHLLEVYLDAAFFPLLKKESFLQEGWRYHLNEEGALEYQGIVFNEMKGAMASPGYKLVEQMEQALYPDITYGFNSGGDPAVIPELTYEEFCDFHRNAYHPSRAIFFFYGNMPLKGHLEFLTQHVLDKADPLPQLPPLPRQERFKRPISKQAEYSISIDETPLGKTFVSVGWLTCHVLEQKESLALSVIENILMSTDASPLKKALLKSGLCTQASSTIEGDFSEVPFIITLQGTNPEHAEALESLILDTLRQIINEGIPENLLDSALHQIEISRSEITGGGYPYGLTLFFRSALFKQHMGKAEYGLMIHSLFQDLRESIAKNPRYLEDLIDKYLIQNPHRVLLSLEPSHDIIQKELEKEQKKLAETLSSLSGEEKEAIRLQAKELKRYQESAAEDDQDCLPKTTLDEVPRKARDFPLQEQTHGPYTVYRHETFTNGITYADLVYPLPSIPEDTLPYVRLLELLLSQVGCGGRSYEENLEYIERHTGGVMGAVSFNNTAVDYTRFHPTFHIKGKALNRKVPKLFTLMRDIVGSLDLNNIARIKEVIFKHYTNLETLFTQRSMKYAINLGASGLNVSSRLANTWSGIEHYVFIKDLADNFESRIDAVLDKLRWLQQHLMGLHKGDLVLTCEEDVYQKMVENDYYDLFDLPRRTSETWSGDYSVPLTPSQARLIPSQVAFTAKVIPTIPYSHPDAPALTLASQIFDNLTLHPRIREQGGAYGSGAGNNSMRGFFYFYAFRDPNIVRSLDAFKEAVEIVQNKDFDESHLEEAKLEAIQQLDHPIPPGSRGVAAYHWLLEGRPHQVRQGYRDRVLSLTREEVQQAVGEHLFPHYSQGIEIVFAGKDLIEKENQELKELGRDPIGIVMTT